MKLTFIGADHEVTGSMHLLETDDLKILIDCGMEQGRNIYCSAELPVSYGEIDYIIATHAHIDHTGMIPKAYLQGFNGTILCTKASYDLDSIMLLDSAHIQETEAEYKNRKGQRQGKEPVVPEYTVEDAEKCLKLFRGIKYHEDIELSDTVSVRFIDAGHILGSASVIFTVKEDGKEKKIVFSGDIGNKSKPIIRDPEYITEADYVIMESTYGDREHGEERDHVSDLARIIQETLDRRGNILIPAFAVGRTQELLYMIREIKEKGLVKGHDNFPVYVDSPMAVRATGVFTEDMEECYDKETAALVRKGINPIGFTGLILSVTNEESVAINSNPEPKVIISASGMCDAGRIRHHIKHNLWRPECSIVFAGYQAEGTLGRVLQDGEVESVKLFGEEIKVAAHIETMGGMSSHADVHGLLEWAKAFVTPGRQYFLVHGDDDSMENLSALIEEETGCSVECPFSGSVFDLSKGEFIYRAEPVLVQKKTAIEIRNDSVKRDLDNALDKLKSIADENKVGTNKDMRRLTEDILRLVNKWTDRVF